MMAALIVHRLLEFDREEAKSLALSLPSPNRRICIAYEKLTPITCDDGDTDYDEDRGWEDEEGVSMEPDAIDQEEGKTAVDLAVEFLWDKGASTSTASSSHFHRGMWYYIEEEPDYRTGAHTTRSYHLKGFTGAEEEQVYNGLLAEKQAWLDMLDRRDRAGIR